MRDLGKKIESSLRKLKKKRGSSIGGGGFKAEKRKTDSPLWAYLTLILQKRK